MSGTGTEQGYGLKDLQCPWIQFQGSLGDCYREAKGMGLCGLYRREATGWISIAKRYWAEFTPQRKIVDYDQCVEREGVRP